MTPGSSQEGRADLIEGPDHEPSFVEASFGAASNRDVERSARPTHSVAHQTEEWVRPDGCLPFCNERPLGSDQPDWPLTERDGFHVNVTLGWGTAIGAAAMWPSSAIPAAVVLWMEAGNVALHTGMAVRERRYNPGLVAGVALMGVHAAASARALRRSGRLGRREGVAAFVLGLAIDAGLPVTMKRRIRRAQRAT